MLHCHSLDAGPFSIDLFLLHILAMTQQAPPPAFPRPSRPRAGTVKAGNATSQHAIIELKQRILAALGKLADRDTQQIAVEELDKIVDTLSADCVSVCLSCLYDSEMQQKSVVKKECVRLLGSLALKHGDLIVPHLPKMIGSIMRRLRDPDSSVRDACVDAMGTLSSRMILSPASPTRGTVQDSSSLASSPTLTLATFSKPLFDALSEQNKSVQTGAAMCLARVIDSARDPPIGALSRLCPRICKFMSNPNFVARPALLFVIGSLSQVGALGPAQLTMVMPCMHEALENNDWATRKAAAESLGRICANPGLALASFRSATLSNLESCRFDKVKPVRDSVLDAIQLWKSLPGEDTGTASEKITVEKHNIQSPSPTASEKSVGTTESSGSGKGLDMSVENRPSRLPKFSTDKPSAAPKRRTLAITDKKVNPEFFQKILTRNIDDWDVDVAVPQKCPSPVLEAKEDRSKNVHVEGSVLQVVTERSLPSKEQLFQGVEKYDNDICLTSEDEGDGLHKDALLDGGRENEERQDFGKTLFEDRTVGKNAVTKGVNSTMDLRSIQKQLVRLEQQQSSLLQMVQEFISSSQKTMLALQARVRVLEKTVEKITSSSNFGIESSISGASIFGIGGSRPSADKTGGSDYTHSRSSRTVHVGQEPASEHVGGRARSVHNRGYTKPLDLASDDWSDFNSDISRIDSDGSQAFHNSLHSQQRSNGRAGGLSQANTENLDLGLEQAVTGRLWDKHGLARRGEGPSARSVWQASKDEATLAAIRVAGEDVEAISNGAPRLVRLDSGSGRAAHNIDGHLKSQWSLWGSVLEYVLAGDMESAYTEVLCTEDAMMLVRLMSKTGPILDQLTVNTASEVLHAVAQLLEQQNYIEFAVAWIQQVSDIVINDGADCLEISEDVKKGLLLGLQDLVSRGSEEECSSTNIEQLLQLLVDAWSFNNEFSESQL